MTFQIKLVNINASDIVDGRPSVVLGLIVVFHPEIRRAIVHLGDAQIFGRFFRRDAKISAGARVRVGRRGWGGTGAGG